MRSQTKGKRVDLVEELIGEEAENDFTHKPDGSYEILNDIVVDRGPNPSQSPQYSKYSCTSADRNLAMSSIEVFGDDEHFVCTI